MDLGKKEEGRRKKENLGTVIVLVIQNALTILVVGTFNG
jgi:hypothetical protein